MVERPAVEIVGLCIYARDEMQSADTGRFLENLIRLYRAVGFATALLKPTKQRNLRGLGNSSPGAGILIFMYDNLMRWWDYG